MLEILRDHPATAGELAEALPIARPGVSRHLRVLREAGSGRPSARTRSGGSTASDRRPWSSWTTGWRTTAPSGSTGWTPCTPRSPEAKEPDRETPRERTHRDHRHHARRTARGAVRVEDVYDTDIDDLWLACTRPERLARWIAQVTVTCGRAATVQAVFTSTWSGPARIEACDAPHHLLLTAEPDTDETTQIEAWLTADGPRTRLVVEERGLPIDQLHFYGAGWQVHLEDLGRSLAERRPGAPGRLVSGLRGRGLAPAVDRAHPRVRRVPAPVTRLQRPQPLTSSTSTLLPIPPGPPLSSTAGPHVLSSTNSPSCGI